MFIILFGITGELGHKVRDRYESKGFKRMHKIYYSDDPDETERLKSEGCDMAFSADEIKNNCDYFYKVNERLVGFKTSAFIKATDGGEDLFSTFSCTDIDFLKKLKWLKNEFVTIVYVYIDDSTLEKVTRYYKKSKRKQRLATGKMLKHIYNNNKSLFDSVVLYGGEDSVFNTESLYSQIDAVIERAKKNEIKLNSIRKIDLPYGGSDPYNFVSYAHKDRDAVEGKLRILQRNGYRLWYDTAMDPGQDWRKVLRNKIKSAQSVIVFASENSVKSEDVGIEIVLADAFDKKIIVVALDNSTFEGTVGKITGVIHAISADSESFEEKMIEALDESTMAPATSANDESPEGETATAPNESARESEGDPV